MGWRQDCRGNFASSMETFRLANATLVDQVYSRRPESLVERKSIYIGSITEAIQHDAGTRQRRAEVEVVCTRHLSDNQENAADLEETADAVVEYLTANYHLAGANTVQSPVRTFETELADGGTFVPAIVITCSALIQEGRL